MMIPILQMRNLRLREIKYIFLVLGFTSSKLCYFTLMAYTFSQNECPHKHTHVLQLGFGKENSNMQGFYDYIKSEVYKLTNKSMY